MHVLRTKCDLKDNPDVILLFHYVLMGCIVFILFRHRVKLEIC